MSGSKNTLLTNRLVRRVGQDAPATEVIAAARERLVNIIQIADRSRSSSFDYAQIDEGLHVDPQQHPNGTPPPGAGYAGLSPQQRSHFLRWLDETDTLAPPAFLQLYLAQLEVNLVEGGVKAAPTLHELRKLARSPAWSGNEALARTALLAYWLAQDGPGLAEWTCHGTPGAGVAGLAMGLQALLGEPLRSEQLEPLAAAWSLPQAAVNPTWWNLRLRSLATNLGEEPLRFALARLGVEATSPRPWRANHRDLRFSLPQPDLRRVIEPLLAEALAQSEPLPPATEAAPAPSEETTAETLGWHLILEFGQSRSELFHFALTIAQRQPGFQQLLDENRKVVYRILFKRSEMRQFWRLWDYAQSWSSARVYLNGQELDKWKVYPYSQYLR
jgi:hypothetical protein